jgi:uncharacterized NAD(P)/FAD-binding protein YdhS
MHGFTFLLYVCSYSGCGVCIAGLTAVDVVKQLIAQGHQGRIHMVSRRGLLPTVKAAMASPFLPLTYANLQGNADVESGCRT